MRVFIALELARNVQQKLEKTTNMLRDCSQQVNWVKPFNFHLTLKFLGEIREEQLEEIEEELTGLKEVKEPFKILLDGLGAFPNLEYPKVIWVGIEEGREQLVRLQEEIEDRLADLGFEREQREYTPHVTLGRVKQKDGLEGIKKQLDDFPFRISASQKVEQISIIKSELTARGPIYTTLSEIKL
ncbi:RNA 2',3'-cyclic phosphodiesterase [Natroniella sulfidigena]|uniref:RNA 2',3'-cyclic phosphodiesterase n=1 Tax=Natroniella sulfidigena TaxID=723921 RepID=UPI00200AF214|nr:RNA 2',3'-cyclic phosphodiesterase [Natroniella sulfidigena]MCK8817767.1 RNA 2',3'-cyclic phosphodiesterase [Natroniella sulfidigena]